MLNFLNLFFCTSLHQKNFFSEFVWNDFRCNATFSSVLQFETPKGCWVSHLLRLTKLFLGKSKFDQIVSDLSFMSANKLQVINLFIDLIGVWNLIRDKFLFMVLSLQLLLQSDVIFRPGFLKPFTLYDADITLEY